LPAGVHHALAMATGVLIVDDDPRFRVAARELLTGRGYEIFGEAGSAHEARAAMAKGTPDAVLVDVNLPDADGIDLAAELRGSHAGVRVLLTSSDPGAVPRRLVERSGARGFVAKTQLALADLSVYL
jgi:DNA-binding NarL/FixJ family response regulator